MRILYLADIRFPLERANGIQTMETCYALARRDHDVTLMVRPDTAHQARDPFEFYELPADSRLRVAHALVFGPASVRRIGYVGSAIAAAVARRKRTDVVMTRDLGVASLVLRLPKTLRPRLVYESHGFAPVFATTLPEMVSGANVAPESKLRRLHARERHTWRAAEGYVTITKGIADEMKQRFGDRDAVEIVPDGVRLNGARRFTPAGSRSRAVVTYAGHLYPWKGVDTLLRAVALVADVRGVIVGGHPAEADLGRLQSLAQSLGIADRVRFTGLVSRAEVVRHLEEADVLVMPHTSTRVSERYASPLKLFEYMAAGKPIVASDLPAVREVLHHGENAWLVKSSDAGSLADGIRHVMTNRDVADRIARCAFNEAASYTWDERAERLERLFERVLSR